MEKEQFFGSSWNYWAQTEVRMKQRSVYANFLKPGLDKVKDEFSNDAGFFLK